MSEGTQPLQFGELAEYQLRQINRGDFLEVKLVQIDEAQHERLLFQAMVPHGISFLLPTEMQEILSEWAWRKAEALRELETGQP